MATLVAILLLMAAGHIRIPEHINNDLKALVEATRRSVQKESEIALEEYLTRQRVEVKRGHQLLRAKGGRAK